MDEVNNARFKEADKVSVGKFPDAVRYKMLREAVCQEVGAASGRPGGSFQWMLASEADVATYAFMADSGDFLTLDMKLAAALSAQSSGEIGR